MFFKRFFVRKPSLAELLESARANPEPAVFFPLLERAYQECDKHDASIRQLMKTEVSVRLPTAEAMFIYLIEVSNSLPKGRPLTYPPLSVSSYHLVDLDSYFLSKELETVDPQDFFNHAYTFMLAYNEELKARRYPTTVFVRKVNWLYTDVVTVTLALVNLWGLK